MDTAGQIFSGDAKAKTVTSLTNLVPWIIGAVVVIFAFRIISKP